MHKLFYINFYRFCVEFCHLQYFTNKDKQPRTRKPSTTAKKGSAGDDDKEETTTKNGNVVDPEDADSAVATVTMEEGDVAMQQGRKRGREQEGVMGGGEGDEPAAKRPKVTESKETQPLSSGTDDLLPSYAVNSKGIALLDVSF